MREEIIAQASLQGLDQKLSQRINLQKELSALLRERDEVEQRIPLWARIVFFHDTPEEKRSKALFKEISQKEKLLHSLYEPIRRDLKELSGLYPLFGLGVAVEECAERMEYIQDPKERFALSRSLEALSSHLLVTFLPGLEAEELLAQISDEETCRQAALWSESYEANTISASPPPPRALLAMIARRLLESDFFAKKAELSSLMAARDQVAAEYQKAKGEVPLLDVLLFFYTSARERTRDAYEEAFLAAEEKVRVCYEGLQHTLSSALSGYPPLSLYLRVAEALALSRALRSEISLSLGPSGELLHKKVLAPRALLLSSAARMMASFRRVFPLVPLPRDLVQRAPQPEGPYSPLLQALISHLPQYAGPLRELGLAHASMLGGLSRSLAKVSQKISFMDRVIFWSQTDDEAREAKLKSRVLWHERASASAWQALLGAAQQAGSQLVPYRMRDALIVVTQDLSSIHTRGGSSSVPMSCPVYNREKALSSLAALKGYLEEEYNVRGSYAEMLQSVALASPREISAPPDAARVFPKLSYEALSQLLAYRLRETEFLEAYQSAQKAQKRSVKASQEQGAVEEQISFWDKINIFTSTPEEMRRDELEERLKELSEDQRQLGEKVSRLFHDALVSYPPAKLYFALCTVEEAIHAIYAVRRSRTVTSGTGKNRKTRTVYYCSLVGLGAAQRALAYYSSLFVWAYGELPSYHQALDVWATA